MIDFEASAFLGLLRFLSDMDRGRFSGHLDDEQLSNADVAGIRHGLKELKEHSDALSLIAASRNVELLDSFLHEKTWGKLRENIRNIRFIVEKDMSERRYFHMLPAEAAWYDNHSPFGQNVIDAFSSTKNEGEEAAKCYATGRYTACVFHCMRVLETGLRVMAADVGISFDIQNWQNVIDQIESEIRKIGKTLPAGAPKSQRLQRLSEAAAQFTYFKDGWRNHVSHNRSSYDAQQALSILNHTRAFMGSLAVWLKE